MMTEKDVDEKITKIVEDYNNKIYDGYVMDDIIVKFKKAIMAIRPEEHKLNMAYVKKLITKRTDEMTIVEVGLVCNMILKAAPKEMYETLEDYMEDMIKLDKVMQEYNKKNAEFEKQTIKTRNRMMQMSGVTKSAPFKNGMHIIGEA